MFFKLDGEDVQIDINSELQREFKRDTGNIVCDFNEKNLIIFVEWLQEKHLKDK